MERFGYSSLKKVRKESTELLILLEAESYGYKMDEKEKLEELEVEQSQRQAELDSAARR